MKYDFCKYIMFGLGFALATTAGREAAADDVCITTFDNQSVIRTYPGYAANSFAVAANQTDPASIPVPPFTQNCGGGKTLKVGDDWFNPKYFHYHLSYEDPCNDPSTGGDCGPGKVTNRCTNQCVDASAQRRIAGTHVPDHLLAAIVSPASPQWCISRLTGNDVPANDANAVCTTFSGLKVAPAAVVVYQFTARMFLYWKEKMAVGTPAGTRYTIVGKLTAVDLPVGSHTILGYAKKYDLIRFQGPLANTAVDNVAVRY